ncbi:winged helix DNA-binding domain-containing protein [Pseudactinotalea sp. Z1739]|uniref:winged helix DNA-binding domain-containing protein n=1 Tax=Pseudactinotalea sp. Z1739 TaxID=3413028 RepID=UPI003C7CD0BC
MDHARPDKHLTARALNRATLARQLLLRRAPLDVAEGVRAITAIQSQSAPSPYLALWNRLADFDPADLDTAFTSHRIVKATLMRITLHAVHAEDYPLLHRAMQPTLRGARLGDARFTGEGLTPQMADDVVPHLGALLAEPRTGEQVTADLAHPQLWWALRHYAPIVHAPTGGPWSFGARPAYVASPHPSSSADPDEAAQHLVRRYLQSFGPARVHDVAQYALIQVTRARRVVETMRDELIGRQGPDGVELLDVEGAPLPEEDTPAPPRLLPMWDSVLLAYSDRSRIIPPEYRGHVIRRNGDTLPAVLVDGQVAGVWRAVDGAVEVTTFRPLSEADWAGIEQEAVALADFVADRDPVVYGRYRNWWAKLPAEQVRVFGE